LDFEYINPALTIEVYPHNNILSPNKKGVILEFHYEVSTLDNQKSIIVKLPGQSKIVRTFMGPDASFSLWAKNTISYYIWVLLTKFSLMDKK
jgi:hypothetical protein